jgi:hypothetical protein
MQKHEAINLIKTFLTANEFPLNDFNEDNNYFQTTVDEEIIAFNFRDKVLTCSALIYQFHKPPKPNILDAIDEEAQAETRGEIKYEADNKTLYILQQFTESIDEQEFVESINTLAKAGKDWRIEILDRVAAKANG